MFAFIKAWDRVTRRRVKIWRLYLRIPMISLPATTTERRDTDTMTMRAALPRSIMVSILIAVASTFATANPTCAAAPQAGTQVPRFYRMMLGDFEEFVWIPADYTRRLSKAGEH